MSLYVQRCPTCARAFFPRRLLCPTCGTADFTTEGIERGIVETTTRTTDGLVVLTIDCDSGLQVVARLLGREEGISPGTELPLTSRPGHPGPAAFVPDPFAVVNDPRRLSADPPLAGATIPGLLTARAALTPEAPLLRCGEVKRTAAEMTDAVARAAGALQERGLARGDRLALMSANRVELLDLILGAAWLGAIAVPVNTAARGSQLHHVLENSQAKLLVIEASLVEHLLELPPLPDLLGRWELGQEPATMGEPVPAADVLPGEPAAILYTSGTTGISKGVVCPHAQFAWWGRNVTEQVGIDGDDVLHTCLPLFHTNALNAFSQALVSGAMYVLGSRFSASRFWAQMVDSGATFTYLLGAMVSMLEGKPPSPLDREHRVRAALAPATPGRLVDVFRDRFGVTLLDGYGSTETNAVIATRPDRQRPGYIGTLQPGFSMRVVDDVGAEVAPGTPGELLLRSDQPFAFAAGYFRMPEATATAWQDLWFHTGDRVLVEGDGWIRFVDRIKDVIRRRGENISSLEVEQVLREHPDVEDVAAYAVDSELGEDEVMAAIIARPGRAVDFEAVVEFCRPRLAGYAIPRFFRQVDALPLTENGKVRKPELRSLGTADAWDRESTRRPITSSSSTSRTNERTQHA